MSDATEDRRSLCEDSGAKPLDIRWLSLLGCPVCRYAVDDDLWVLRMPDHEPAGRRE